MTIEEAKTSYGVKEYQTSVGDSLYSVCRAIYKSDDEKFRKVLRVLNPKVQWMSIGSGTVLEYLEESYCNGVS